MKLTLSYAGFLVVAGVLLLAVVWVFLLRYVPDDNLHSAGGFIPNRSDLMRAFGPAAAAVLLFLLMLGLVGGWFLAGRMLAPLTRIADAAQLAANGSLSHRVGLEGPRDELRGLSDVFDTMLQRLETHVGEQQRFAANASHELRTPLAISQALLDVARHDPARDADALIERLGVVNTRAIELTEALLLLSRADRRSFTREVVDLSLVAEEAAETLLPLAERCGVNLTVTANSVLTPGSDALLLQMTINLLHNAIVHNRLADGAAEVRVEQRHHTAVLTVENTGHALAPELVATLAEPFQRGAQRSRGSEQHHAGTGLGLAIVRSIAHAHDGNLTLTPRAGGGFIITVDMPAVPRTTTRQAGGRGMPPLS